MLDMDDGVVEMQFGEVFQHQVGVLLRGPSAPPLRDAVAEQHLFGDEYELFVFEPEPAVDGRHGNAVGRVRFDEVLPMVEGHGLQSDPAEQLLQVLPAAGAFRAEQHARLAIADEVVQGLQGLA